MKRSTLQGLSNMPYQHLRLDSTEELFVWTPDATKSLWAPTTVSKNETVEQNLVWWSNRGFCTARPRMCGKCRERWARHKRVRIDSNGEWKEFYCDACVPPLNVELPRTIVLDVSSMAVNEFVVEHVFAEEVKPEPEHVRPENPRGLWDSYLHPNAKIKERH